MNGILITGFRTWVVYRDLGPYQKAKKASGMILLQNGTKESKPGIVRSPAVCGAYKKHHSGSEEANVPLGFSLTTAIAIMLLICMTKSTDTTKMTVLSSEGGCKLRLKYIIMTNFTGFDDREHEVGLGE
jgi:hypothetical protein